MMKYKQMYLHDPANGIYGDCMRTALACLLDKHPNEVPHFLHDNCGGAEFNRRIDEYLETQGLSMIRIAFAGSSIQEIVDTISSGNPDTLFLISGRSERGTNHVVIACNCEIEHDPHPSGAGLCEPFYDGQVHVEFLVPRNIHRRATQ